jgi:hypothetical protein
VGFWVVQAVRGANKQGDRGRDTGKTTKNGWELGSEEKGQAGTKTRFKGKKVRRQGIK